MALCFVVNTGQAAGVDVGMVGFAAAGQGDVERLAGHRGGDHGVGGVDGGALGAVHGGGVAELDMLGDVLGRQLHDCVCLLAARANVDVAVGVDRGDLPAGSVTDVAGTGDGKPPVVATGGDPVPGCAGGPVVQG